MMLFKFLGDNIQGPILLTCINFNSGMDTKLQPLWIKGIKNGWPCIVEIRGTQGCALVGDPARAVGEIYLEITFYSVN